MLIRNHREAVANSLKGQPTPLCSGEWTGKTDLVAIFCSLFSIPCSLPHISITMKKL